MKQIEFITCQIKGRHTPWGSMSCLSKRVLEITYYRISPLLGRFGKGSRKAGVHFRLDVVRKQG